MISVHCISLANDKNSMQSDAMFTSFSFHPMTIDGKLTYIAGARLLYHFNQHYAVGVGSFNMISRNIKADFVDDSAGTSPTLAYNFFAADFEYFFNPEDYMVFSAKSTLSLSHVSYNLISTERTTADNYYPDYGADWFVFVEPSANITLNLTRWMRTSFGLGYRIALNGDYQYGATQFGNSELSGFSGAIYLTLGNF